MKKIYYISNTLVPSSKANFIQSMHSCLILSKNFNVTFCFPNRGKIKINNTEIKKTFDSLDIKKNFEFKSFVCIDSLFIKRFSEKIWFRVLSISFLSFFFLNVLFSKNLPIIYSRSFYSLIFFYLIKFLRPNLKLIFECHHIRPKYNFFLKKINYCFAISNDIHKYLLINNIKSIQKFHKVNNFTNYKIEKRNYRQKLRILYFGSFRKEKGVPWLIKNYFLFKNKFELTLVGQSSDEANKLLKKNLNSIKYLEFKNQKILKKLINQSDILIAPYLQNNDSYLPMKLIEYLPLNKIILVTKTHSSFFLKDKINCLKFNINCRYDIISKLHLARHYLKSDHAFRMSTTNTYFFNRIQNYNYQNKFNILIDKI